MNLSPRIRSLSVYLLFLTTILAISPAARAQTMITTTTLPNGMVGQPYNAQLMATNGPGTYFWTADPAELPPGISVDSTGLITGTPTTVGSFNFDVTVQSLDEFAFATLNISIPDAPPPPLQITTSSLPDGTVNQPYQQTLTAANGMPPYNFSVLQGMPPGLTIFMGDQLTGTPTTSGNYSVQLQVMDGLGATATRTLQLIVVPEPLTFPPGELPEGNVGQLYAETLVASGGTQPYVFTAAPGTLPPGLSIVTNQLKGTPTAGGIYTIPFTVTDNVGTTAKRTFQLVIQPAALTITTNSLPNAIINAPYTQTLTAAGGSAPYTFFATSSSQPLPTGLSITNGNQVTGTPTTTGTFQVQFTVVDSTETGANKTISITIVPALTITTNSLPNGTAGVLYTQPLNASGGTAPYVFSAVAGTLPAGLSVTVNQLTGTPTAPGTFPIQFEVLDSQNVKASKTISVTIAPPALVISTNTLANGTVGVAYTQPLTAAGGTPPYVFSAAAGTLPPGLSITANQITGTPTTVGTVSVQLQVLDSQNVSTNKTIPLAVAAPTLVITTSTLANGTVGVAYSQPLAASGGVPPYTFSTGASKLPPGLSISGNQLAGTPTTAGSFSVQFQVTDIQQVTATRTIGVTIGQPLPLQFITTTLPEATIGMAYSAPIAVTGGAPPYALSAPSANLPPGLSIAGLSIAGTPSQVGNFSIPMELRDTAGSKPVTQTFLLVVNKVADPAPVFQAQPSALLFQTSEGNTEVAPQDLVVTSTGGDTPDLSFTLPGAPTWLSVSYQPGTTPAQLRVRVMPAHLPSGTFQAVVRLAVGSQTLEVPVTLVVSPAQPQIEVSPRVIQLTSQALTPRSESLIVVRNNGGGPAIDIKAKAVSASRWITSITLSAPRFTPAAPAYITLAFDTTGLNRGAYRDEILIETSQGDFRVPVSLFVDAPGAVLDVSLQGIRLPGRQGDQPTAQQTIEVRNTGTTGTTVNWSAAIIRGDNVFTLSTPGGTATPGSPSSLTIGLKSNATSVAGGHSALLRIDDPQSANSPQYVVLVADIDPLGAPPQIEVSTAGLLFIGVAGAEPPAGQTFRFSAGGRSLNYQATTSTSDGGKWLQVSPASGVIPVAGSQNLRVSVETSGLPAGIYSGLVSTGIGTTVRGVGVTLILVPSGTAVPGLSLKTDSVQPRLAAGCTPSRTALVQTTLAESFLVPAGWPATITAKLLNDCGESLGDGSVIASFSNGDAPIVLEGDRIGTYTGTWQPGVAAASATVRVEGARGTLQPAVLEIIGGVRANPLDPPSLTTSGALNNFNPVIGAALAPGTVTQISGNNLAPESSTPSTRPLPTSYHGVEVIIGGLSAPIFEVSKTEVTIQVPSELAPNKTHSLLLVTDSGYTLPVPLALVPVQPGTLIAADGIAVAQHADGSLVTSTSPALPGEAVSIFLVGMGATTPTVASGTQSPNGTTVNVGAVISVDSKPADVLSQGLVPGAVGLYQINFRVPSDAAAGLRDIAIAQDSIPANQAKLIIGTK